MKQFLIVAFGFLIGLPMFALCFKLFYKIIVSN